jgi:predicted RecB family nuclease
MQDRLYLAASGFYNLLRPSRCERRVWLKAHGEPEGAPSELDILIKELGERHEKEYLSTFREYVDLSEGSHADRSRRTREAVATGAAVIYQGVLRAVFPGARDVVTGIPDFLIRDGDAYTIRDCKLSRSADAGEHPELTLQLQAYGWLFQQSFGRPPGSVEVCLGNRTIETLAYDGGTAALKALGTIRSLSLASEEPYEPVGWSKCGACPFNERCWKAAEGSHDVSLVYGLDQGTALALRAEGTRTYDELLKRHTAESLSSLKKPRGARMVRVGSAAERILEQARALATGKETRISDLSLPRSDLLVMLDLEAVSPQFEEAEKVYLWGAQVCGTGRAGAREGPIAPYAPAVAGFGPSGDREGWELFLSNCRAILESHGDIPFVHWSAYEKTKIKGYIERYGDAEGTATRVLRCCFDLMEAVKKALVLPVYSYSLKVIEGLAGFARTQKEFGGDWSIARYIRAAESTDADFRERIMREILTYNEEDLRAMWAVFLWAKAK